MKYTKVHFVILMLCTIVITLLMNKLLARRVKISNKMVKNKYHSLVNILGDPTYLELDYYKNLNSATWMSPRDNFNDFGKYGGCDYIKLYGNPSKKYHPYPAQVFVIVGKYLNVPEHLLGPLKHASETINIDQLFVPDIFAEKYHKTGEKDFALVTGSCASITISVITIQFVIDMINKYKNTRQCLELYQTFRNEYDTRIDNYLCGKGITNEISWFSPEFFDEQPVMNIDKCNQKLETFIMPKKMAEDSQN